MTEAVAAITFDLKSATKPGSVGIPWPGTYVQIVDVATGEEVPVGEDGEKIVCSGQISNRDISSRQDKDQYTMLNALIMSEQLGEHASFEKQLELYDELIIQAKKEFSWIK